MTISDAVYGTLDGTLRLAFDDGGERSLKNIARPLRVWARGRLTGAAESLEQDRRAGFPVLDTLPVVASDSRQEVRDLANALTHEMETYLGSLRWLRVAVIKTPRAGAITLTTDLRACGDRLRLESRLQSPDGQSIWRGKYDGDLSDVLDWQDATGSAVASQAIAAICEWQATVLAAKPQAEWTWQERMILVLIAGSMDPLVFAGGLDSLSQVLSLSPPSSYPYEIVLALVATASSLGYSDVVAKYSSRVGDWSKTALELSGQTSSSRILLAFSGYVQSGDSARAQVTCRWGGSRMRWRNWMRRSGWHRPILLPTDGAAWARG